MGLPYLTFGRFRPLHTTAVIFAFGGNVLFAASLRRAAHLSRPALERPRPLVLVLGYTPSSSSPEPATSSASPSPRNTPSWNGPWTWCSPSSGSSSRSISSAPSPGGARSHLYVAHWFYHRHHHHHRRAAHRERIGHSRVASPKSTRCSPASRMRWCSGGTAITPSGSS